MQFIDDIVVFGDPDENTMRQMRNVATTGPVVAAALMADNHYGYSMPIGGVVAYDNAISPSGVGYDISCGIKATKTALHVRDLSNAHLSYIADRIQREVAFGVGRVANVPIDDVLFDDPLWKEPEIGGLFPMAEAQLGTVGSGNHFVDILSDEDGWVWIMVHFGSRGFGHKVATGFLNLAANRGFGDRPPGESMDALPTVLSLNTDLGQYYWNAMVLAGRYAYAGRDAVTAQVLGILDTAEYTSIHNHHNFAWQEVHRDQEVIVVRKGATPAFPGQYGAVGGSMGDKSVILKGVDSIESVAALHSTVHGAGPAAGKVKWQRGADGRKHPVRVGTGAISLEDMQTWLSEAGVILRGAGLDEAPQAYRRLSNVLVEHAASIDVLAQLQPLIVVMAGDEYDPYKD